MPFLVKKNAYQKDCICYMGFQYFSTVLYFFSTTYYQYNNLMQNLITRISKCLLCVSLLY